MTYAEYVEKYIEQQPMAAPIFTAEISKELEESARKMYAAEQEEDADTAVAEAGECAEQSLFCEAAPECLKALEVRRTAVCEAGHMMKQHHQDSKPLECLGVVP